MCRCKCVFRGERECVCLFLCIILLHQATKELTVESSNRGVDEEEEEEGATDETAVTEAHRYNI